MMNHVTPARVRSSAVVCALAVLVAGCGSGSETTSHASSNPRMLSSVDRRRTLQAVSLPDVSAAGASVQQQLREGYASLRAKMQDRGTTDVDLGTAYGEMGKLLMAAEYRDAAEPCLLNAEVLVPYEVRWPYYLGHLYKIEGDGPKSAASFARALQARPDDVMTLVSLGDAYLDQGRIAEAEQLFTKALSVQSDSAPASFGLGRAALANRKYARAVSQLTVDKNDREVAAAVAKVLQPLECKGRGAFGLNVVILSVSPMNVIQNARPLPIVGGNDKNCCGRARRFCGYVRVFGRRHLLGCSERTPCSTPFRPRSICGALCRTRLDRSTKHA